MAQYGFIHGFLGQTKALPHEKYRKFVEERAGAEQESPLMGAAASTILGSEEFIAKIQERHVDVKAADRNLPALRQLVNRPAIVRIIELAKEVFGENARLADKAAVHLCHRYSGVKLREIGKHFGVKESAVSQPSRRFEMGLSKDKELKKKIEKMLKELNLSVVSP